MYFCIVKFQDMATIKFLYRSTKPKSFLTLRFQFRNDDKQDFIFDYKTKIFVTLNYWSKQHGKKSKDIDIINKQHEVNKELNKVENHLLKAFNQTNIDEVTKDWFNDVLDLYYNPQKKIKIEIPTDLIGFIDYYINENKHQITQSMIKKHNVVKHKLERFQTYRDKQILIKDINENFKNEFVKYQKLNNYATNTIQREIGVIKTFCRNARYLGLETHVQLDKIKTEKQKVDKIYLTFDDLNKIEQTTELTESLENAKDWLIISCYTGQRISDFLRFTADMIRVEDGKQLLEFTQKKTGKNMTVPLHTKVIEILNKRNGNFPRPLSEQRYNDYIKEVCKLAGIDTPTKGAKKIINRKVEGVYPKYELVTSHIGRRSFATNFYGKISTTYLTYVTGHSKESEFINYIGKSNKDLALEMADFFK